MEAQKPLFDQISVLNNLPTLPHILLKLFEACSQDSIQGEYITDQSIRGWLPGSTSVLIEYTFPQELSKGEYTLELGLVFHSSADRLVPIANEGKTTDGWYKVGYCRVE